MKKYIIIVMDICSAAGAEQYVANKSSYLESHGYHVFVFSSFDGDITIKKLEKYKEMVIPNLMYPVGCFTKKERQDILMKMTDIIGYNRDEDDVYIESTNLCAGEWGELLAEKLKCTNLIFELSEKFRFSAFERKFLKFKLDRHELFGITEVSVKYMLEDNNIPKSDALAIKAYCSNVVQDVDDNVSGILDSQADYTIGSVGRLEKEYVPLLLENLKIYCSSRPDKKYNIIFVGDSANKTCVENVKNYFNGIDNVKVYVTGYLYPIPKRFLQKVDLFISTAGAAYATFIAKRPSILIHPISAEIIGVHGSKEYSVDGTMYDANNDISYTGVIDEILTGKLSVEYCNVEEKYEEQIKTEFARQLKLFEVENSREYYDIGTIKVTGGKYNIYRFLGYVLGGVKMQKFLQVIRKIRLFQFVKVMMGRLGE